MTKAQQDKESWEQELEKKIGILLQLPNAEGALMPMLIDFISTLLEQARKEAREEAQMILAEVIDNLYLAQKEGFCGEGRPHNLGRFKEQVKSAFHFKLEQL